MPQLQLPFFPQGMTLINASVGFVRKGDTVTYFHGSLPIFSHNVNDQRSFRMISSQLYVNGGAKQSEICRAFGISPISMKRGVKLYREKGVGGFFEQPRRRGAAVLTPEVLREAQELLDAGYELPAVARELNILADTLRKAARVGKLHKSQKKTHRHANKQ